MPISRRSRLVRRLLLPATLALLAACAGRPVPVAPLAPPGELDPGDRRWVERTLASLTVRDKVGQMVMPWISGAYVSARSADFDTLAAMVMREGVGGLVISNGLPLEYAAKLNALQQRARVPLLVASDMESGPGMRLGGAYVLPYMIAQGGGTDFPPAMALGAADSDSLAWATGRVLAAEARAVGVQMAFGPVLDVNSNPANPIINIRSFGEDAGMVARLAGARARGGSRRRRSTSRGTATSRPTRTSTSPPRTSRGPASTRWSSSPTARRSPRGWTG